MKLAALTPLIADVRLLLDAAGGSARWSDRAIGRALQRRLRESKDASGHEHAADGRFGAGSGHAPKGKAEASVKRVEAARGDEAKLGSLAYDLVTQHGPAELRAAAKHYGLDATGSPGQLADRLETHARKKGASAVAAAHEALAKLSGGKEEFDTPLTVDFEGPRIARLDLHPGSVVKDVSLAGLCTDQETVDAKPVAQYIDDAGDKPVEIARKGGKNYVIDGNHRAVAAMLRGDKAIKARFVDLDAQGVRESKDSSGHEHKGKGEGGGQFVKGGGGGGGGDPDKAKFIGQKVGKSEHLHADKVKNEVADMVGGLPEELTDDAGQRDKKPYDVKIDHSDAIEVKSLQKGSKQELSVHPDSLLRKVDYLASHPGEKFHTIAVDERATYEGGAHAENHSGNRLYYRRGSGRYPLAKMHPVKNAAELKRLIAMPDDQLPERAHGALPSNRKEVKELRVKAEAAHASRLRKDTDRKARIKAARQGGDPS